MITTGEEAQGLATLLGERSRLLEDFARHARQPAAPLDGRLAEMRAYALATPGKLLRPLLMLEACRAAGGDPERIFPAAAGTEYGHVASLIHDDIIDDDAERRGRQTVHVTFGIPSAILTGDLLIFETFLSYTQCFDRGIRADSVLAAIRTLSTTCIEICRGQAYEERLVGNLDADEQCYLEVIRLKTASVCRAATRIGALLSEASPAVVEALSNYGEYLGLAFQIVDDLLCFDGRQSVLGKSPLSDVRNQRVTLPVIYALQSEKAMVRSQIREIFSAAARSPESSHQRLTQLLIETRSLDRARALAQKYTARAEQELDSLPVSEAREALRALAELFISRDH